MTYRNLETIGKAIAYNMVDKDEKSLDESYKKMFDAFAPSIK